MQVTSLDSGTNVDEVDALTLEHVLEKLNITEYREKFLSEKIDLDTLVSRKRFSEQVLEALHFVGWRFNMIYMTATRKEGQMSQKFKIELLSPL